MTITKVKGVTSGAWFRSFAVALGHGGLGFCRLNLFCDVNPHAMGGYSLPNNSAEALFLERHIVTPAGGPNPVVK